MHKKIHRFGVYRTMIRYLDEDIEILANRADLLAPFAGKNILITGATGLIGGMILNVFRSFEEKNKTGLRVFALVRNLNKAKNMFGDTNDNLRFIQGDVNDPIKIDEHVDYIVHTASVTSSKLFVEKPVETITTLINGTKNVLELAKEKNCNKVVQLSSLEVYGTPNIADKIAEDYVGYIDFTAIRSSYSEGKRMTECLCNSYFSEYGVPVVTARLTQTFGPGVKYDDGRVFAQFARSVIEGNNIGLNTAGKTLRNYCYIRDAVSAIFLLLAKGIPGEVYNVANKETGITIADMARMVCDEPELGNGRISVVFNNPSSIGKFGYNPEMRIELDTTKLESLGWKAEVGLVDMYKRLIHDMKLERK